MSAKFPNLPNVEFLEYWTNQIPQTGLLSNCVEHMIFGVRTEPDPHGNQDEDSETSRTTHEAHSSQDTPIPELALPADVLD